MRNLKLYTDTSSALTRAHRLAHNPACSLCPLGERPKHTCMKPVGDKGGVLLVTDFPNKLDDKRGLPLTTEAGRFLRNTVARHWGGSVAADYAVKCCPVSPVVESNVTACRPYLANTVHVVQPSRILAFGSRALLSLLGRSPNVTSVRRGIGWLDIDDDQIPVFMMPNAGFCMQNKFQKKWLEEDIEWALKCDPLEVPPAWGVEVRIVQSVEDSEIACRDLKSAKWFAYDTETCGVLFEKDFTVVTLAAATIGADHAWVWPQEALYDSAVYAPLRELLEDPDVPKVGQNLKYDAEAVYSGLGTWLRNHHGDTRLWRRLIQADADARLDTMAELVGMGGMKEENDVEVSKAVKVIQKARKASEKALPLQGLDPVLDAACAKPNQSPLSYAYALVPEDIRNRYCARDALATARLGEKFENIIEGQPPLAHIWHSVVKGSSEAITQVEAWGISASRANADLFLQFLKTEQDAIKKRFDAYPNFNPNSPKSVGALLFDELKLPEIKDRSTAKEVLQALLGQHPIVEDLIEWRRLDKLRGTYAEGVPKFIREDGRIHPSIKIDGTETGRLSCMDPNLQNIPRPGTQAAKFARDIFVAPPGHVLLEVDYSQLELRVATMLSQDPDMLKIWQEGVDYHLKTAQLISQIAWGVAPEDVTSEHRSMAKTVNFGVIYGMTSRTLAERLGCSEREAQTVLNAVKGKFQIFAQWCGLQHSTAMKEGYVWTEWNGKKARRRPLWQIADRDQRKANNARNAAVNCLDAETEALTQRGWIRGFDLREDDVLLTKNAETGALEWQQPTDLKFFPDYEGEIYEFKSRSFHAVTTPAHRWLVTDKHSSAVMEKTSETLSIYGDHRIHRTGEYAGCAAAQYTDDFVELAGWWLTDGYHKKTRRVHDRPGLSGPKPGPPRLGLCQSVRANPHKVQRIEDLLARLEIPASARTTTRTQCKYWEWSDDHTAKLKKLFPDRALTVEFLCRLTQRQLRLLLNTMIDGDGSRGGKISFVAAQKQQAESFQILASLCGQAASMKLRDMRKYAPTSEKLQNVPRGTQHYVVTLQERDTVQVQKRHRRITTKRTPVWCPMVPNSFFVARRSGQVYITGNTPVQGTASDFCLASIVDLVAWLKDEDVPAKLVLTVHDSVMFEVREDALEWVAGEVRDIMTGWPSGGVPLIVDAKIGKSWGSLSDYCLDCFEVKKDKKCGCA